MAPQNLPVAQIPQPFILPHHNHFPLQSEQLWTAILDPVWRVECPSSPFDHSSSSCCIMVKVGADFRRFWIPHYDHFLLQLEFRGECIPNLFCALNPPVNSIWPWGLWLLRYKESRRWFSKILNPPLWPLSTTIRVSRKVYSRPVLLAESACIVRLTIDPLGGALQRQSVPIFENCANLI